MIYRKRGSVARWENGTLVRVSESGVALERGELFECHPETIGDVPHVDESRVLEAARVVQEAAGDVAIERLILIDGIALHEYRDEGFSSWTEHTQRMHLSLTRGHTRALLDLASFDPAEVSRIAAILARAEDREREAPPRLRLAPNVTAALLPSLVGIAPPNVRLVQTAGGVDGYGAPIIEATGPWPNAYRPSYRMRPIRMPLNLRIECDVTEIERDRPVAVALLAPASTVLRVLIDDGERAYPSTVRVTRIDAVSAPTTWYPYAGGSFGAEMML
ncbi:MAG TPA: hypothetical protein VGQ76_15230 [Thermoanaerobaculia bacterium]|jgi:hypothetical protein|nr:hypothetical protein [Thermoanaerobaculia bacterium]